MRQQHFRTFPRTFITHPFHHIATNPSCALSSLNPVVSNNNNNNNDDGDNLCGQFRSLNPDTHTHTRCVHFSFSLLSHTREIVSQGDNVRPVSFPFPPLPLSFCIQHKQHAQERQTDRMLRFGFVRNATLLPRLPLY